MSVRPGAPYDDQVQDNGKTLIYEGHDNPVPANGRKPKEATKKPGLPMGSLLKTDCSTKPGRHTKMLVLLRR